MSTHTMTIREAKQMAAAFGCTLRRSYGDEFRVNIRGGGEETAYYTDDLADAVKTAQAMGVA